MTQFTTIERGGGRLPVTPAARRSADDRIGRHLRLRLQHAAAAGAVVALGVLAPGTAGASTSSAGQPVPGPDDLTTEQPCDIDLGPCPGPDPEPCDPNTEICDLLPGGNGPDDPCEGEAPPEDCDPDDPCEGEAPPEDCDPVDPCEGEAPPEDCDPSTSIVPQTEVDVPVRATPNFTG